MDNFVPKLDSEAIESASKRISEVIVHTNLEYSDRLSKLYKAKIYLKREDLQTTRSYKIRGAYNFISNLSKDQKSRGIVTASAGNHAQGVAFSANKLKIMATIFMPTTTQTQKINRVKSLGDKFIKIILVGENFDESSEKAIETANKTGSIFVPPFDDDLIIAGQGTVGKEIYEDLSDQVDVIVCPVGGGGLIAGLSIYFSQIKSDVELIGVEPIGADAMQQSIRHNRVITLKTIDTFVDGAAVKTVGIKTFEIVRKFVKKILLVPVGKICLSIIELYQEDGIITEPAGALSVSALDLIAGDIKDKTIVCIISGGNNDIMRYPEIIEKAEKYKSQQLSS
jgi:threonine dehydratase